MPFEILDRSDPRFPQGGPNVEDDQLSRQIRAHRAKKDEREEFTKETVVISTGPKNTASEVVVKYPRSAQIIEHKDDLDNVIKRERVWTNGRFVFAVYTDNPNWHRAARDEWESAARNALEKFCALRGATIKMGPRAEDMNRYNIMVEVNNPIQEAVSV